MQVKVTPQAAMVVISLASHVISISRVIVNLIPCSSLCQGPNHVTNEGITNLEMA